MAEADFEPATLTRCGPLDGIPLPTGDGVAVSVAPFVARFVLRCDVSVLDDVQPVFGSTIPRRPNGIAASDEPGRSALCLGPDEWLLLARHDDADALRVAVAGTLDTHPHSLTDVSHRQVGLDVSGLLAARVLSAGCPLDLRLASFPVGTATRTLFAKAEIILWRRGDRRFHVEVWRSFAPYVIGHLGEALASAPGS